MEHRPSRNDLLKCLPVSRNSLLHKMSDSVLGLATKRIKLHSIVPANDGIHKYIAHIYVRRKNGWRTKSISFGAHGYSDYILYNKTTSNEQADEHKRGYLLRHAGTNQDWTDPETAGFWSRWVLWNKPSLEESVQDILRCHPDWRML